MIEFFTHPEYVAQQSSWETYRDLFEGDHHTLTSPKYLWPHELESSKQPLARDPQNQNPSGVETVGAHIRRVRSLRSRYFNLFEPVVSTFISLALGKPMALDPAVVELLGPDGLMDIDGRKTSFVNFIRGPVAIAYFRDGKPLILVDAPRNNARSRAEERTQNFRPYMEVIDVLAAKDWQASSDAERFGRLELFRYEFEVIAPRPSLMEEPQRVLYTKVYSLLPSGGVQVEIYRQRNKEGAEAKEWVLDSSSIIEGLEEVPVAACLTNESWVKDVAEQQLVLFNLMSAYYNVLNSQAFQRIFISGELTDKHIISISEYAVGQIPHEAKPYVIEPSNSEGLLKAIDNTMDKLYRVAFNRTRGVAMDSREAPGASTLREMAMELVAVLLQAVTEIEALVNEALRLYAVFKLGPEKGKAFAGRVVLSKDITIEDVQQQIELYAAYRDEISKVLSWRKAHLRKVVNAMGYTEEERLAILQEIEALKEPQEPIDGTEDTEDTEDTEGTEDE